MSFKFPKDCAWALVTDRRPQSVAYICAKLVAPSFSPKTGVRANAGHGYSPPLRPFFWTTHVQHINVQYFRKGHEVTGHELPLVADAPFLPREI